MLVMPNEPKLADYADSATKEKATKEGRPNNIRIIDLSDSSFTRYTYEMRNYDKKLADYKTKEKAIKDLSIEILTSITRRYLDLIKDCDSVYDKLYILKRHLCPTTSERHR